KLVALEVPHVAICVGIAIDDTTRRNDGSECRAHPPAAHHPLPTKYAVMERGIHISLTRRPCLRYAGGEREPIDTPIQTILVTRRQRVAIVGVESGTHGENVANSYTAGRRARETRDDGAD